MSHRANCWRNPVMERFFPNLKMKRVWRRSYTNHSEAIKDINQYIVAFYNTQQLYSALGHQSPGDYEKAPA